MTEKRTSRLRGFYEKSVADRVAILADYADLDADEVTRLRDALSLEQADHMVENVVGLYALPLGIGANFLINGRDYLIPMVIEEPSVIAAVSYAARLARHGDGFVTGSTPPIMIGQVQLLDVPDMDAACAALTAAKAEILALANTSPTIARLGGGPVDLELRPLSQTQAGPMLIVHLLFDTRDAMGANAVNTAVETIAPRLEQLSGGRALLRILSNLADRRRAWATVAISLDVLGTSGAGGESVDGVAVGQAIAAANAFAVADPYRAATHNKGIMNGIDAVALATGNDWRSLEAGAHAYAARTGHYQALTQWQVDSDNATLTGRLELPLAVGTVGGTTRAHPLAQVALKILGVASARELAEVMAAVGLAQNLAALRALATDGIQRGHMALHARQVAIAAGATGTQVDRIAEQLAREGEIRVERAQALIRLNR
ncbi:MAG: hydroxymethylglutaryl-CoA reductase, degradative [Litorilinea sp.]